jgi:hypothetical protein
MVQIPKPNDKCQFAPSVTPNGTVYFGRSDFACDRTRLMSYPVGGPVATVASLRAGRGFADTYAVTNDNGSTTVLYDLADCRWTTYWWIHANIHQITV